MPLDFTTIVTSAAVGAVSGSIISFWGAILERKARRKEILLNKAVELAIERARFVKEIAKETSRAASIQDAAVMSATYFNWLEHVLDKGSLPEEVIENQRKQL